MLCENRSGRGIWKNDNQSDFKINLFKNEESKISKNLIVEIYTDNEKKRFNLFVDNNPGNFLLPWQLVRPKQ